MEKNKFYLSKKEKKTYINLITERFLTNPRMLLLFDNKNSKKYRNKVKKLVEYCFAIALRLNGTYITKNKKTIVLFYEYKKLKRIKSDYIRYCKVLLNIKPWIMFKVLKNEKEIKKNKLKLKNYIYVWFIA